MTTSNTQRKTRIITLTDRPPVQIVEDDWPMLAQARSDDNRWSLRVRLHADGRAIVYGVYTTTSAAPRSASAGELLAPGGDIVAAIRRVAGNCDCMPLVQECIANLPPEKI